MRNFFNGNGDDRFDFDGEGEDEAGQDRPEVEISLQGDLLGAMELDLAELGLNQMLLDKAILVAKQDWLWMFRSPARKLRRIEKIYLRLGRLVMIHDEQE